MIWFTNSRSATYFTGTGGFSTMSIASSRAASVTTRSPLAYMSAMYRSNPSMSAGISSPLSPNARPTSR